MYDAIDCDANECVAEVMVALARGQRVSEMSSLVRRWLADAFRRGQSRCPVCERRYMEAMLARDKAEKAAGV